jgi:hypothetical protein
MSQQTQLRAAYPPPQRSGVALAPPHGSRAGRAARQRQCSGGACADRTQASRPRWRIALAALAATPGTRLSRARSLAMQVLMRVCLARAEACCDASAVGVASPAVLSRDFGDDHDDTLRPSTGMQLLKALILFVLLASADIGAMGTHSRGLGMGTTLQFSILLQLQPPGSDEAAGSALTEPVDAVAMSALVAQAGASLPAYCPPPLASPRSPLSPLPSPVGGSALNILVAEDDLLSQTVMHKVLARLQLQHTIVGTGDAAVEAFQAGARLDVRA